jgi:hypothetical protein
MEDARARAREYEPTLAAYIDVMVKVVSRLELRRWAMFVEEALADLVGAIFHSQAA